MARPDSIPNSAVKRCIADGSASIGCARVGSRQIFFLKPGTYVLGFFNLKLSIFTSNLFLFSPLAYLF